MSASNELRDTAATDESLATFRKRLRQWLRRRFDGVSAVAPVPLEDRRRATAQMFDDGLIGMTWPVEYGGRGLPTEFQTVWNEEVARYGDFLLNPSVTVGICAPTLLDLGSEQQRIEHLPRMLRGDEIWTQLLSEPGAGSDLASVSTTATRQGSDYIVTGQKVWTSAASDCDYALALVRTAAERKRHAGLSMLIVDLKSPGVDVRPLRQMTGEAIFNEVFLDSVQVPAENLVGELNGGWIVLTRMLAHERIALSAGTTGRRMDGASFDQLAALAQSRSLLDDTRVRDILASVHIEQRLLDYLGMRIREALQAGARVGPIGSLGKVGTAKAARTIAEAAMEIGGMSAVAWPSEAEEGAGAARLLLRFPASGIAGGTTEIQKNIIAERLLGLPRESRHTP